MCSYIQTSICRKPYKLASERESIKSVMLGFPFSNIINLNPSPFKKIKIILYKDLVGYLQADFTTPPPTPWIFHFNMEEVGIHFGRLLPSLVPLLNHIVILFVLFTHNSYYCPFFLNSWFIICEEQNFPFVLTWMPRINFLNYEELK